jgi:2-dehydro-3-deoxyphosphooctonate aldolase (KDO 8-P synthase)
MHILTRKEKSMILIAGPCVIEENDSLEQTADYIRKAFKKRLEKDFDFYFKSSCVKDNRTLKNNFRGVGFKNGIERLIKIKNTNNFRVCTDFHSVEDVENYGALVDLIQVPAFLGRQTSLLEAVGRLEKDVHYKKPQFTKPEDVWKAVDILRNSGAKRVIVSDRGVQAGNDQIFMDPRNVLLIRKNIYDDVDICVDVTHPNKFHNPFYKIENAQSLAFSYIVSGARGIFLETHPKISEAQCDQDTQLPIEAFSMFVEEAYKLYKYIKNRDVI